MNEGAANDTDAAWFSDGISEEILQAVARGTSLRVIGRSSSFQFRGKDKAAANVAAQLKATHILDGSVRQAGGRVRINAYVVEAASQTTIWSDGFNREMADVLVLQDDIAA